MGTLLRWRRGALLGIGGVLALACSTASKTTAKASPVSKVEAGTPEAGKPAPSATVSEWPMLGHDTSSTYFNPAETILSVGNVAKLTQVWEYDSEGGVTGAPAVVGGVVYALASSALDAFDAKSGAPLWSNPDVGGSSAPTVADGVVYVNTAAGGESVYAVDAKTGKTTWHTLVDTNPFAAGFSSPVLTDKYVIVGDASGEESVTKNGATFRGAVVAFDRTNGQEVWRFHTTSAPYNGCSVWSTVSLDPALNQVFAVTGNNYTEDGPDGGSPVGGPTSDSIFALDIGTGQKKWQLQASQHDVFTIVNPRSPDSDFGANPIVLEAKVEGGVKKLLGAGQKSGVFWMLERDTGKVVWHRKIGVGSAVGGILNNGAYDGERIIVAANDATSTDPGSQPGNGDTPGSYTSVLAALDPSTGDILWEHQLPAYVWAPITIANGVGFVAAETRLQAFDVKTGKKLFEYQAGGTISSAPVVVNGRVYFGSGMQLGSLFGHADTKFHALAVPEAP